MKIKIIKTLLLSFIFSQLMWASAFSVDCQSASGYEIVVASNSFDYGGYGPYKYVSADPNSTYSGSVTFDAIGLTQINLSCLDGTSGNERCSTKATNGGDTTITCNQGESIKIDSTGYSHIMSGSYAITETRTDSLCTAGIPDETRTVLAYITGLDSTTRTCRLEFSTPSGQYNSFDSRIINKDRGYNNSNCFPVCPYYYTCNGGEPLGFIRGNDDPPYTCPEGQTMAIIVDRTDLGPSPGPGHYAVIQGTLTQPLEPEVSTSGGNTKCSFLFN